MMYEFHILGTFMEPSWQALSIQTLIIVILTTCSQLGLMNLFLLSFEVIQFLNPHDMVKTSKNMLLSNHWAPQVLVHPQNEIKKENLLILADADSILNGNYRHLVWSMKSLKSTQTSLSDHSTEFPKLTNQRRIPLSTP